MEEAESLIPKEQLSFWSKVKSEDTKNNNRARWIYKVKFKMMETQEYIVISLEDIQARVGMMRNGRQLI